MLKNVGLVILPLLHMGAHVVHADEPINADKCPGPVYMSGASNDTASAICEAAEHARILLKPCGLLQKRPVFVDIVNEMDDKHEACVAYFNCDTDRLTLLAPSSLAKSGELLSAFQMLSTDEYFRSVVVHEMAHAFAHQSHGDAISRVAHEYLAYAIQIASLPNESRSSVLEPFQMQESDGLDGLDEIGLLFGPSQFAVHSFLHFSRPENGCSFVTRIVDTDPKLPDAFQK